MLKVTLCPSPTGFPSPSKIVASKEVPFLKYKVMSLVMMLEVTVITSFEVMVSFPTLHVAVIA